MKNIVIGAVNSTKNLLEEMLKAGISVDMVFALDDEISENVSAYYPLHEFAQEHNIPYKKYRKINDIENIEIMKQIEPDYIFAIGFSQLISKTIIEIPKYGVIGSHPADLPKYRGRAVVVWQMLEDIRESKVTLFKIDEGADSGEIIDKEPYYIEENDYAEDVLYKADVAQIKLFRRVLPKLMDLTVTFEKQDDSQATYALRRIPEDGIINWGKSGVDVVKLIRATSRPYPGAFAYYDGKYKIIIWRAHFEKNVKYIGIPGQIAEIRKDELVILAKDGQIVVTEYDNVDNVKIFVGHKLKGEVCEY